MESKEINPKLYKLNTQIKELLKKNNVMGTFFLADGEGHGEYCLGIDVPDWSKIKFDGPKVSIGIHMKSDKENSAKTINGVLTLRQMMDTLLNEHDTIVSAIMNKVSIQQSPSKFIERDKNGH